MNIVLVLIGLGLIGIAWAALSSRKDDKKIQELEDKKIADQKQLEALQKEQAGLKDAVTRSQEHATEADKKTFWEEELGKK